MAAASGPPPAAPTDVGDQSETPRRTITGADDDDNWGGESFKVPEAVVAAEARSAAAGLAGWQQFFAPLLAGGQVYEDPAGTKYEGERDEDGVPHGAGRCENDDGSLYDGQWARGVRHGKGKFRSAKGDEYDGDWVEGKAGRGHTASPAESYEGGGRRQAARGVRDRGW